MPQKNENNRQETSWVLKLANIFRNPEEKRVRSLGRMLIFTIVIISSLILITLVINLLIALIFTNEATDLTSNGLLFVVSILQMLIMPLAVLATLWIMAKYIDKRKITDYGLKLDRTWWTDLIIGLFISITMIIAVFGVELSIGWTHIVSFQQNKLAPLTFGAGLLLQMFYFIPIVFFEEVGIRGYLTKNICEGLKKQDEKPWIGAMIGLVLTSLVIAVSNTGNFGNNWLHLVIFVISLCTFGLVFFVTGQLGLVIGLHLGWLIFQGAVLGFNINGEFISNSIIVTYTNGPRFLTGGNFGPLGGFIGVVFTLLGAFLGILYVKWTRRAIKIDSSLANYEPKEEILDTDILSINVKK